MLTITDLPGDILDHISVFLPSKDLGQFLCTSRQITISAYLRRDRQRAYWKKRGAEHLAAKADLQGLQYLHSVGAAFKERDMNRAAANGHLAVVQYLHSVAAAPNYTHLAMYWAAANGHLAVVQFLHRVGAPYFMTYAIYNATNRGHLAVVEYLQSF